MNNFPAVIRDNPVSVITPVVPLNFVYPGLSLAQLWSIVWAHRTLIFLIMVLVLSITVLALKIWPRTYSASATLMVNYQVNDPLNGKELPVGQVGSYIATQVELMQTQEVLLQVVDRLNLSDDTHFTEGYTGENGSLPEWVATQLRKNLSIYQGQQGSQLIYINFEGRDPTQTAQIVNTITDIYKEQDYLRSTGPPGERAERYAEQLAELKNKVDIAQKQVTDFHLQNNLIDVGNRTDVDMVLLANLEGRLVEAQHARRAAGARANEDQSVSDKVLESTEIQTLKTRLADQEVRLAYLNSAYTPLHPDLLEFNSQINTTRRLLANAIRRYDDNEAMELHLAQQMEQNLLGAVNEQREKVLAMGRLHDGAAKYLLQLETAKEVYQRALEGYDRILFASAGHDTNISIVSRAAPPVKASNPKILKGLIAGVMLAGLLGFGIPLAAELLNRRVRCRDDLERQHGVPVLMEFNKLSMRRFA